MRLDFTSSGLQVTSALDDNAVLVWDFRSGDTTTIALDEFSWRRPPVTAFSTDAARLVACSGSHELQLWNTQSGARTGPPLRGHVDTIQVVVFSPTGDLIASASSDGEIRLWDAHSLESIITPRMGHDQCVYSLAFSPNGTRLVSGGRDRTVCVWDVPTGLPVGRPLQGHSWIVTSVIYSPNGKQIASGSQDCTVRVWEAATGTLCFGAMKQDGSVLCVVYSPDGKRIASGGLGSVHLWDSKTGELIKQLKVYEYEIDNKSTPYIAFSPSGRIIVRSTKHGVIRFELGIQEDIGMKEVRMIGVVLGSSAHH